MCGVLKWSQSPVGVFGELWADAQSQSQGSSLNVFNCCHQSLIQRSYLQAKRIKLVMLSWKRETNPRLFKQKQCLEIIERVLSSFVSVLHQKVSYISWGRMWYFLVEAFLLSTPASVKLVRQHQSYDLVISSWQLRAVEFNSALNNTRLDCVRCLMEFFKNMKTV